MANILHIIESLSEFGGTPRKLMYLAEAQSAFNHKNYFFCYLPSPLYNKFIDTGCSVTISSNKSFIKLLVEIRKECKRSSIDIICTHFTRPLILGTIIGKSLNLPVIHNEHSSINYRRGIGLTISRFVIPHVDGIICNSEYTKKSVGEFYKSANKKSIAIHNPVKERIDSTNIDIRKHHHIRNDVTIVGHIGGMIPSREHVTLVRAFYKAQSINSNLHLIIIGDGPSREAIEHEIKVLNMSENITLVGYTNSIRSYLNEFDIYVNTTIDEGFGIAVAEAMLQKVATIAANSGAHPELIKDKHTGLLHRKSDADDLSKKILKLANNVSLRDMLGNNSKAFVESKFNSDIFSSKYYSYVTEVLNIKKNNH